MDPYRLLREQLKGMAGATKDTVLCQGIVEAVQGNLCTVAIGGISIPGVRLKASELDDSAQLLVTPKVGTAVTVGSLSGDLTELVVLKADRIESIVVNGGRLGGLVNIAQLTERLNRLVEAFNGHTHRVTVTHPGGTFLTVTPTATAAAFDRADYEDTTVKH